MSDLVTPFLRGYSRVFLIEGGARPDRKPVYQGCMMAGGVSQEFGDVENIECPSPDRHGDYEVVGQIQSEAGRATLTLTGRYPLTTISDLLRLAKRRCPVEVVIVSGACTDPSDFDSFDKAKHLSGAFITSHSTEDEGSLTSGDESVVNESADISAEEQYEVMPLAFTRSTQSAIAAQMVDVTICDAPACGKCGNESSGCLKIYAVTRARTTAPADLVYSLDGGRTWHSSSITTLGNTEDPTAVACVGGYVVVSSSASNSLHYVRQEALDGSGGETWTEVTTGFVAAHGPLAMASTGRYLFIAGAGGYVYGTEDVTAGVEVLNAAGAVDPDTGNPITDNLYAIDAVSRYLAVAVGASGAIMATYDGETWTGLSRPIASDLNALEMTSERVWLVGTASGRLYYTTNGGDSWAESAFPGSGAGAVHAVKFVNEAVGYLAHATAAPRGRILRTHNGGNTWYLLPESGHGSMPAADRFEALAACPYDPNLVVGVGLADNGTDGILVVGRG